MDLRDVAEMAMTVSRVGQCATFSVPTDRPELGEWILSVKFSTRYWDEKRRRLGSKQRNSPSSESINRLRSHAENLAIADILLRVLSASLCQQVTGNGSDRLLNDTIARCETHKGILLKTVEQFERLATTSSLTKLERSLKKISAWNDLLLASLTSENHSRPFAICDSRYSDFLDDAQAESTDNQELRTQLQLSSFRLSVPNRVIDDGTTILILNEWIGFARFLARSTISTVRNLPSRQDQRMISKVYFACDDVSQPTMKKH